MSRGGLVDPAALDEALRTGHLSGAVIDVTYPEPPPADWPYWDTPNLIITPHVLSDDIDAYVPRTLDLFFGNLRRYFAGEPLTNRVDLERQYSDETPRRSLRSLPRGASVDGRPRTTCTDASLEQRLVRVVSIREAAIDVLCFDLDAADRRPLAAFTPARTSTCTRRTDKSDNTRCAVTRAIRRVTRSPSSGRLRDAAARAACTTPWTRAVRWASSIRAIISRSRPKPATACSSPAASASRRFTP